MSHHPNHHRLPLPGHRRPMGPLAPVSQRRRITAADADRSPQGDHLHPQPVVVLRGAAHQAPPPGDLVHVSLPASEGGR